MHKSHRNLNLIKISPDGVCFFLVIFSHLLYYRPHHTSHSTNITMWKKSKLSKMPKDKTSKAVRYAKYKRLEEGRLFDGVKKLVSFMNLLCKKTNMSKS